MTKTATVSMRIDEKTKEETEQVLESIGLNMSTAFNVFCKQVIRYQGLPFTVGRYPVGGVTDISNMSRADLIRELNRDVENSKTDPVYYADDVTSELRANYGL